MLSDPTPRPAGRVRPILQALLGVLAGAIVTEAGFRYRDGGAFPLVNVFEQDARRGVRLHPDSETSVGARGERVTHVRTNGEGYRGPAWPPPSPDEVVVIGDSLSFGLGVEESEALPARLHGALRGSPAVLDASVPTYGPPEYLITMEDVLSRRRPGTVVLVLNLLNDFAEIAQPNTARHGALDGYAVRVPEGGGLPASSPLREAAIRRSHTAFALWRWERAREATAAPAVPEEGVEPLIALAVARQLAVWEQENDAYAARMREWERQQDLALALDDVSPPAWPRQAERHIIELVGKHRRALERAGLWAQRWNDKVYDLNASLREPLFVGCGWSRGWRRWTPSLRLERPHQEMRDALRRLPAVAVLDPADVAEIEAAFREADQQRNPHPKEPATPARAPVPVPPIPMESVLQRARAMTEAAHVRLVVVSVPLDAQISPEARERHGVTPEQGGALDRLLADLTKIAVGLGAIGVAPWDALRSTSEPAYLPDGHLSAAGHDAVARAVADAMDAQPERP